MCRDCSYNIYDPRSDWKACTLVVRMNIEDFLKTLICCGQATMYKGVYILKTENTKLLDRNGRHKRYIYAIAGELLQKKPFSKPYLFTLKDAKEWINENI